MRFIYAAVILFVVCSSSATGDEVLKKVQKECKKEISARNEAKPRNCTLFMDLLTCVAKVNTSFINKLVEEHVHNCTFPPEFIQSLQKYALVTEQTPSSKTEQTIENYASRPSVSFFLSAVMSGLVIFSILHN